LIALGIPAVGFARAGEDQPSRDVLAKGAELFAKEWLPQDAERVGSDGLGPVYNETSCIACHHQGGPGGAGPTSTNVEILSVTRGTNAQAAGRHPGFRTQKSVVLHRFGVDRKYSAWRLEMLGKEQLAGIVQLPETEIKLAQQLMSDSTSTTMKLRGGRIVRNGLALSERNPPALFGAGLIDALPDEVVLAGENQRFEDFPEIKGRASHTKDGRVGRFGWKAETPNLRDFVMLACANELGLEVPGHHQALSPLEPLAEAKGLDLTQQECDALVAYVGHLPAPTARRPAGLWVSRAVTEGRSLFEAAGCMTCHQARLGKIDKIYSDLLLHDMGPALSDSGGYYGISEPGSETSGVKSQEWRTPPLWGFRDSGPYLHDGRAQNLEQAVALHGGQSEKSAKRFFELVPEERLKIQAFLRSLAPPVVIAR
jgi:CxxC motif-containing protein (DUF1111 family)